MKRSARCIRGVVVLVVATVFLVCFELPSTPYSHIAVAVESPALTVGAKDAVYTGSPCYPELQVTCRGESLAHGVDYYAVWRNNTNAGTATVRVRRTGKLSGIAETTFTIAKAPIQSARISGIEASYEWTGVPIEPKPTLVIGSKQLKEGLDYDLAYSDNRAPGVATITISGKRNLIGKRSLHYQIVTLPTKPTGTPRSYASAIQSSSSTANRSQTTSSSVKGSSSASSPAKPKTPESKSSQSGMSDTKATQSMKSSAASGSNKSGKKNVEHAKKKLMADANVEAKSQTYTGSKKCPKVKVMFEGHALKEGADYTVRYSHNVNAGTAYFRIYGKGRYCGSKRGSFKIQAKPLTHAAVSRIPEQAYTGSQLTPKVTVEVDGVELHAGEDYAASYDDNVERGRARVSITGKGNYRGTKNVYFKIRYRGERIARQACEMSYSRASYHGEGYDGTTRFLKDWKKTCPRDWAARSCDRIAAIAVRKTGADPDMPKSLVDQRPYLHWPNGEPSNNRWKRIGVYHEGDENRGKLQPGDLVVRKSHICIYVGKQIPQEVYRSYLKGKTPSKYGKHGADRGQPKSDACWVSGHRNGGLKTYHNAASCIGTKKYARPARKGQTSIIYRYTGPLV